MYRPHVRLSKSNSYIDNNGSNYFELSILRLQRKNIQKLMKEYLLLRAKMDTAREFYANIPINETQNRLQAFRKWLELYLETNRYMIEVVNRFSPQIARDLKSSIISYSERANELLKEEHWKSSNYAIFSEEQLNKLVKEMLDDSMTYADIHQKEVQMAFIVAIDTLKRTKGELPLEPEELIVKELSKHDQQLAKIYEGAYEALASDNPERYRHCSVSMREILDGLFGKNEDERTKFIRNYAKSKSEFKMLESLDRLVRSIDKAWNKGVHDEIQPETAILAMRATELILSYIFRLKKE